MNNWNVSRSYWDHAIDLFNHESDIYHISTGLFIAYIEHSSAEDNILNLKGEHASYFALLIAASTGE